MSFSIEKYKKDIADLIERGSLLYSAMLVECKPDHLKKIGKSQEEIERIIKALPDFLNDYQAWYSEAKVLLKQILPERLDDFVRYYEKPKQRKEINVENYRIEDYLHRINVTQGSRVIVDFSAAIPLFNQQLAIISGLGKRFVSSLYEIRLHLQAEMFDDELDAAVYLLKNKFVRAAGAMAGVVLERQLKQVCFNHRVAFGKKKKLTIGDLNEALKASNIIDAADWSRIRLLGELRNKCDHDKIPEPTEDDVNELIDGVKKITKTLF